MILDPNVPEDLYSIEKCRNIKNEIMNFGVNNREILKIIEKSKEKNCQII